MRFGAPSKGISLLGLRSRPPHARMSSPGGSLDRGRLLSAVGTNQSTPTLPESAVIPLPTRRFRNEKRGRTRHRRDRDAASPDFSRSFRHERWRDKSAPQREWPADAGIIGSGNIGSQLSTLQKRWDAVIYFDRTDKLRMGNTDRSIALECWRKATSVITRSGDS